MIFKKSFTNISLFSAVQLTRFEINEKLIYSGYSLVFDGAGRLSFGNFLLVMLWFLVLTTGHQILWQS